MLTLTEASLISTSLQGMLYGAAMFQMSTKAAVITDSEISQAFHFYFSS